MQRLVLVLSSTCLSCCQAAQWANHLRRAASRLAPSCATWALAAEAVSPGACRLTESSAVPSVLPAATAGGDTHWILSFRALAQQVTRPGTQHNTICEHRRGRLCTWQTRIYSRGSRSCIVACCSTLRSCANLDCLLCLESSLRSSTNLAAALHTVRLKARRACTHLG